MRDHLLAERVRAAGAAHLSSVVQAILETLAREAEPSTYASYLAAYTTSLPGERQRVWQHPEMAPLLGVDLRVAHIPRLRTGLEGLFTWVQRAGFDPERALGASSMRALLERCPTVEQLVSSTLFGCHLPMAGLYPAERAVISAELRGGSPPAVVLDHRLSGQVLHELSHGRVRPWRGPSGAWMLLEAAASWVSHQVAPIHTFPNRVGEGVPGLRGYVLIGAALARVAGADALLALTLCGEDPAPVLGRRLTNAMAAAEWQVWRTRSDPPFAPDNRDAMPWVKLVAACADVDGPMKDALDRLWELEDPGPVSSGSRGLLQAAESVPWDELTWWHEPVSRDDVAALHDAVLALCTAEKRLPHPTPVRCAPPGGEIRIDVAACRIEAPVRADGVYLEPATWLLPPPLARRLLERGSREIVLRGVCPSRLTQCVDLLQNLVSGDAPMPPFLEREVRDAPPVRVQPEPGPAPIRYPGAVVSLGSCFAASVGARLATGGFGCCINPFGTLYDPVSIARALRLLSATAVPTTDALFRDRGRWHSRWFHTTFSRRTRAEAQGACDSALTEGRRALASAEMVLITWGTAVCYIDNEASEVVANCHGLDPSRFTRTRLSAEDIVAHTLPAIDDLIALRPGVTVILTVSPIRHLDRGAVENSRSKATLILAAEQLCRARPQVHYFPAYEILLDELRDHRWYRDDGVHPSQGAIDHVAHAFFDAWLHPRAQRELSRRQELQRDVQRLPRDPWQRLTELRALRERASAPPIDPNAPPLAQIAAWVRDEIEALSDYAEDVPEPTVLGREEPDADAVDHDHGSDAAGGTDGLQADAAPAPEGRSTSDEALAEQRARLAPPADPDAVKAAWRDALRLGTWSPANEVIEMIERAEAALTPLVSPPADGGPLLTALLGDLADKAEDVEDPAGMLGPLAARAFLALSSRLTATDRGWVEAVADAIYAGRLQLTPELVSELSPMARTSLAGSLRPPPRRRHPDAHPFKRALDTLSAVGAGAGAHAAEEPVDN